MQRSARVPDLTDDACQCARAAHCSVAGDQVTGDQLVGDTTALWTQYKSMGSWVVVRAWRLCVETLSVSGRKTNAMNNRAR